MTTRPRPRHELGCARQRGQVLLLSATLVALAIIGTLFAMFSVGSTTIANRVTKTNEMVLIQARDALIGRAVLDSNRPGSLPCPDTDDDGIAELLSGTACPSYIGRLPWKTLGLPDPRDGNGERLWYALSPNFRDSSAVEPLNSDTKGNLMVYSGSTATVLTLEAVAIVFAPGAPIGSQTRDTAVNQNIASNYLETASGINNATGASGYIEAPTSTTFNDQLLVITTAELMTPVERRAANEILTLLQSYRNSGLNWCSCYPFADVSDGNANDWRYYGRVPLISAQQPGSSVTPKWSDLGISVPPWLTNNLWWWVFFYTVSDNQSANHGGGTLTVDGTSGYAVVLITTGPAGSTRPVGSPGSWNDAWWSYYVDDSNNSDLGVVFITPTSTAYARDRLYKL